MSGRESYLSEPCSRSPWSPHNVPETNRPTGVTVEEGLATIRDALSAIAYGSLVLTVHEGRVVQIDVTQRKRFKLS